MLSDGENTAGPDPVRVAEIASVAGVKVYPVGLGSPEGTVLQVDGFQVSTALDEAMLRQIAQTTDGTYFAAADEEALQKVYDWALAQPVMNIHASEYIGKVQDFDRVSVAQTLGAGTASGNAVAMVPAETQLVSLFELEEAWIGVLTTGRFKELWDKGADFIQLARPKEGTFPVITTITVSKSTTEPDAAMQFVNHVLSKQVQVTFATKNLYAPTVKNAELPPDFKYRDLLISGDSFNRLFIPDQKKIAARRAEWREQFMRLTSR